MPPVVSPSGALFGYLHPEDPPEDWQCDLMIETPGQLLELLNDDAGGCDDGAGFPNRAIPVGSDAYYARRFCPPNNVGATPCCWHGTNWCRRSSSSTDPGVARLKLDWWRQEVSLLSVRRCRHPLTVALQNTGVGAGSEMPMSAIIEAADDEIRSPQVHDDGRSLPTAAALSAACSLLNRPRRTCSRGKVLRRMGPIAPRWNGSADCPGRRSGAARLGTTTLRQSPAEWRTQRLDALLAAFDSRRHDHCPYLPRAAGVEQGNAQKNPQQRLSCADTLVERAPIALLWDRLAQPMTAYREHIHACRLPSRRKSPGRSDHPRHRCR